MSADNGIFILHTSSKDGGDEYRVAHGGMSQFMEIDEYPEQAIRMFHDSEVFTVREDALTKAMELYDKTGWTEYGLHKKSLPVSFDSLVKLVDLP